MTGKPPNPKDAQDKERWQQINKIVLFFDLNAAFVITPAFVWLCYLNLVDVCDTGWCGYNHAIRMFYATAIGTPIAFWAVYGVIRQWTSKGMPARITRMVGSSYLIVYAGTMLGLWRFLRGLF